MDGRVLQYIQLVVRRAVFRRQTRSTGRGERREEAWHVSLITRHYYGMPRVSQ